MSTLTIRDEITRRLAQERIAALDLEKYAFDLEIKRHVKQRSGAQNRLQHKWYGIISTDTGYTLGEVKEEMIRLFSPQVESKFTAGEFRPKRTSEMNTAECSEFMERITAWAGGFGIFLPAPEAEER